MLRQLSPHVRAVLHGLFVTFLWSTSFVLVKIGLKDIPALTFAGLRYTLAFLCLLPLAIRSGQVARLRSLSTGWWTRLIILGLLFYSLTQGAVFLSLAYLPAATVSLLLSFTPVFVALLGISMLGERPTALQWGGIALCVVGVLVYFYPVSMPRWEVVGLVVGGVGLLANALSSVLGAHRRCPGPGTAAPDRTALGHDPLAGGGQQCVCLHPLEPHSAHPVRYGVEHHQQYDAVPDCFVGLDIPG